jgi:c-di-GMP-binding flagellar brake protein YcgR
MPDFERLPKEKSAELIGTLVKSRLLVKVAVPKTDFEQLTVVTKTNHEGKSPSFQIDPPAGLLEAIRKKSSQMLFFEFVSDDRLPHRFEASIKQAGGEEVWLDFPNHIQRYQLRNNFRIKAPANANATTLIAETKITMIVDNISLGGVYCHCPNHIKESVALEQCVAEMCLVFSFGGQCHLVTIDQSIVRRIEGRTRPRHFGLAFEFLRIKMEAKQRLTQIVYDLQRDYLRRRVRD